MAWGLAVPIWNNVCTRPSRKADRFRFRPESDYLKTKHYLADNVMIL